MSFCCSFKSQTRTGKCKPPKHKDLELPSILDSETFLADPEWRESDFHIFYWDPCHGGDRYELDPKMNDSFFVLNNGSIYLDKEKVLYNYTDYCLRPSQDGEEYVVIMCFDESMDEILKGHRSIPSAYAIGMFTSVPFLVMTYLVYWIVPELWNMHGWTLRGYVGTLVVAYTSLAILQIIPPDRVSDLGCYFFGKFVEKWDYVIVLLHGW